MRKFAILGALLSTTAFAADLPVKKAALAPVATATSPLYVFVHGGGAFTSTQSDIAIPGTVVGTPKVWPAGVLVGGGVGYLNNTGVFSFGAELEANYDFSHASIGCTTVCLGEMKNSWFFAEKLLAGITLSQIMGYIPGAAQPSNLPVPITVPQSIYNNVQFLAVIGLAQRNVDLCAMDLTLGTNSCASQWKNGVLYGAQANFAVSQNMSLGVEYDFIDFGHGETFTPAQAVPLFANTVAAKDEQRFVAKIKYNF